MAKLGNNNKFYIRTNYGPDQYAWLACETGNSLNRTQEAVECSDKSDKWARFLRGKRGVTAEATVYTDNTSTEQQHAAIRALCTGAKIVIFIGELVEDDPDGTGEDIPQDGDILNAIVTAVSDTNDFGAVASRTFSFTASGYDELILPEDPEPDEHEN